MTIWPWQWSWMWMWPWLEWAFQHAVANPLGYVMFYYPHVLWMAGVAGVVLVLVRFAASVMVVVLSVCFGRRRARDGVASFMMGVAVYAALRFGVFGAGNGSH